MKYQGMHIALVQPGGPRWPFLGCDVCQQTMGPSGRAIWDATLTLDLIGCMAVCSDRCEQALRDAVPTVQAWDTLPVDRWLTMLALGTGTAEAVSELLEVAALGRFVEAARMPASTTTGGSL